MNGERGSSFDADEARLRAFLDELRTEFPRFRFADKRKSALSKLIDVLLRALTLGRQHRYMTEYHTVIGDTRIRDGDRVVLWYASGNRDEEVFEEADRFLVTRDTTAHQTFGGGGRHFCLGNQLARLELRVMLEELLRRIPDMEIAGPVRISRTNLFHNILELPVAFTPGRAGEI